MIRRVLWAFVLFIAVTIVTYIIFFIIPADPARAVAGKQATLLTPIAGYCDFVNPSEAADCGGPTQWAYHMLLPWLTFALLFAALYVRMIRANVIEALHEDYVRTARAKGAPASRVIRAHVLRNALLPVATILGMDIGTALGGAIFTESIYGLPGLGHISIQGLNNLDLPTVQGVVVFATTMIIIFNLVVDLLYAWIDPRIRLA